MDAFLPSINGVGGVPIDFCCWIQLRSMLLRRWIQSWMGLRVRFWSARDAFERNQGNTSIDVLHISRVVDTTDYVLEKVLESIASTASENVTRQLGRNWSIRKTIPRNIQNFANLQYFSLTSNEPLESLAAQSFYLESENLPVIDLSNNSIDTVPPGAFHGNLIHLMKALFTNLSGFIYYMSRKNQSCFIAKNWVMLQLMWTTFTSSSSAITWRNSTSKISNRSSPALMLHP